MNEKFLAIIDPACARPETDSFNFITRLTKLRTQYHLPALLGMDTLLERNVSESLAGIICLGSSASVYDERPWQEPFHAFMRQQVLRGVPTLGLCYGHQMLAHIFGAKIKFHSEDQSKLKGMRTVSVKKNMGPSQGIASGELFYTHREVIASTPDGFEEIATSEAFGCEAIAHKTLPTWGFQAHLEATPLFTKFAEMPEPLSAQTLSYGTALLRGFIQLCEEKVNV